MGTYEFCAIQGAVSAQFRLPDGKVIDDKFAIVYVDRDSDGILRVRADSDHGPLPNEEAHSRLRSELRKWAEDVFTPSEMNTKEATVLAWMNSARFYQDKWEGFYVKRPQYGISFQFASQYPMHKDLGYAYEVRLRDQKR